MATNEEIRKMFCDCGYEFIADINELSDNLCPNCGEFMHSQKMITISESQKDIMYKMANNYNEMLNVLVGIDGLSTGNIVYKKNILKEFEAMIKEMA